MDFSQVKKWLIPVNGTLEEVKSVSCDGVVIWKGEGAYAINLGAYVTKVRYSYDETNWTSITSNTLVEIERGKTLYIQAETYTYEPRTYRYSYTMTDYNFNVTRTEADEGGSVTVYRTATPSINTYSLSGTCTNATVYWYSNSSMTSAITSASYGSTVYYKCQGNTGYNTNTGSVVINETNFSLNTSTLSASIDLGSVSRLQYVITMSLDGEQAGSWSTSSATSYYGDTLSRSGDTITCKKWEDNTTRGTSTFTNATSTEYDYHVSYSSVTSPVAGDQTIVATTSSTRKTYTITFALGGSNYGSWSHSTLTTYYGDIISRSSNTVSIYKGDDTSTLRSQSVFTNESATGYTYSVYFNNPTSPITSNQTITATTSRERQSFTIKFTNGSYGSWSSNSKTAYYGDTLSRSGDVVTCKKWDDNTTRWTVSYTLNSSTAQYTYSNSYSSISSPVTSGQTITSTDTRSTNRYTITLSSTYGSWKNASGTVVTSISSLLYGTACSTSSNTLTVGSNVYTFYPNTNTAQYTYTFSQITNVPDSITGDVTIYGSATRSLNTYTITWKNWDGTTLETDTGVSYGSTPSYNGNTPTRAATAQYSYVFSGWSPSVATVTGNATYTAQFNATINAYTITWKYQNSYENGTTATQTYNYGATPSRNSPDTVTSGTSRNVFTSWDNLATVTGNRTITAQYQRQYNVTISASNCGAYTDTSYSQSFTNGWKNSGTVIYWKTSSGTNGVRSFTNTSATSYTTIATSTITVGGTYSKSADYIYYNVTVSPSSNVTANYSSGYILNGTTITFTAKTATSTKRWSFSSSSSTTYTNTKTVSSGGQNIANDTLYVGMNCTCSGTNCSATNGWYRVGTNITWTATSGSGYTYSFSNSSVVSTSSSSVIEDTTSYSKSASYLFYYITVNAASGCTVTEGGTGWYLKDSSNATRWTVNDSNRSTFSSDRLTNTPTTSSTGTANQSKTISSPTVYTRLYRVTLSAVYGSGPTSYVDVEYNTSISSNGQTLSLGSSSYTFTVYSDTAQYDYTFASIDGVPSSKVITSSLTITGKATVQTRSYPVSFAVGTGLKSCWLSTSSTATSGSGSGTTFSYGTTVYLFGKAQDGYYSTATYVSGGGAQYEENAIYRLGSVTVDSNEDFGTVSITRNPSITLSGSNITYKVNGSQVSSGTTYYKYNSSVTVYAEANSGYLMSSYPSGYTSSDLKTVYKADSSFATDSGAASLSYTYTMTSSKSLNFSTKNKGCAIQISCNGSVPIVGTISVRGSSLRVNAYGTTTYYISSEGPVAVYPTVDLNIYSSELKLSGSSQGTITTYGTLANGEYPYNYPNGDDRIIYSYSLKSGTSGVTAKTLEGNCISEGINRTYYHRINWYQTLSFVTAGVRGTTIGLNVTAVDSACAYVSFSDSKIYNNMDVYLHNVNTSNNYSTAIKKNSLLFCEYGHSSNMSLEGSKPGICLSNNGSYSNRGDPLKLTFTDQGVGTNTISYNSSNPTYNTFEEQIKTHNNSIAYGPVNGINLSTGKHTLGNKVMINGYGDHQFSYRGYGVPAGASTSPKVPYCYPAGILFTNDPFGGTTYLKMDWLTLSSCEEASQTKMFPLSYWNQYSSDNPANINDAIIDFNGDWLLDRNGHMDSVTFTIVTANAYSGDQTFPSGYGNVRVTFGTKYGIRVYPPDSNKYMIFLVNKEGNVVLGESSNDTGLYVAGDINNGGDVSIIYGDKTKIYMYTDGNYYDIPDEYKTSQKEMGEGADMTGSLVSVLEFDATNKAGTKIGGD